MAKLLAHVLLGRLGGAGEVDLFIVPMVHNAKWSSCQAGTHPSHRHYSTCNSQSEPLHITVAQLRPYLVL